MSNQTIPDPQRSTDPGRFSTARQQVDDTASGGQRVLAALGLLALLVGIPALLWFLAGTDPFPTELPSKETLTSQLDFTTLLNVLVFVVWVAWLMFVVCVVAEVIAARRGGLAQPVPLGGPLQKLARTLVGALGSGCGSGGDVESLQQQVDGLEATVARQQEQIDALEADTDAVRAIESRLDDIEGLIQGLVEQVPELGQLQELIDQLRGLVP